VGLEAPEPPMATERLCLLVLRPGRDPVRGVAGRSVPRERHRGGPSIGGPRPCLLAPRPWLVSVAGQEPKAMCRDVVDQVSRAQESLEP
jgi:hypothetical protein